MKMSKTYYLTLLLLISFSVNQAQELLTKEMAISLALENNYGIKMAENSVKVAENNASIYNSGYLPSVTGAAGVNYNNDDAKLTEHDGTVTQSNGTEFTAYNASIGINYTLFDGLGRSYNYKRLQENYNLSELEAQTVIQNTLLQIYSNYYEVARITENKKNIAESLNISKQRLERVTYGFDYGQNTKLDVLNAEVDVNNDSIRYINENRLLTNSKRNLNLLLGRDVNTDFTVSTDVTFKLAFDFQTLLAKANVYNIEVQKVDKSIQISEYDIKISKSNLYPFLNLYSSYVYNLSNNDTSFTYNKSQTNGFNAGVSLSWNIFDGGNTKTRIENSKIYADNLLVEKEQVTNELERNVANALEIYNNAIFIMNAEEVNVETNIRNFERSEEQFKLGQITSIEFRLAQVNLLNAQSNLNQAKFDAKNAEIFLINLTGELLNTVF
jgi:outer membrane protein TolC